MPLGVRRGWPAGVGVYACLWIHWKFVSTQLRAASFTYFGEVLRSLHKRIGTDYNESVHRKKQHTRGNNTIPYKLATLMTFETFEVEIYFRDQHTHCYP